MVSETKRMGTRQGNHDRQKDLYLLGININTLKEKHNENNR